MEQQATAPAVDSHVPSKQDAEKGIRHKGNGRILIEGIERNSMSRFHAANRSLHERGACQRLSVAALCERAAPASYLRNTRRAKLKALRERMNYVPPKVQAKYKPREWWQEEQKQVNQQLYDAAKAGDIDMADQALSFEAEIDKKFHGGVTALSVASSRGHIKMAEFLISRGAEVNSRDKDGNTALMHSIRNGNPEIATMVMHIEPPVKADWDGNDLRRILKR